MDMNDELFDRGYQNARAALNADLAKGAHGIIRTIGDGLRALHRFEWSAPWAQPSRPPECR